MEGSNCIYADARNANRSIIPRYRDSIPRTLDMSVKKFFRWTSHNCIKIFKNWTTSIQNRKQKKKYNRNGSAVSISNYGYRGSVSTEVTILDDGQSCPCCQPNNEVNENRLNESIEKRKCSY